MFTLEINGNEYAFNFGFGFVKEIQKAYTKDGQDIGLSYRVAQMYDGDVPALLDVLAKARVDAGKPTITEMEAWLENDDTDIDKVFEQVFDFLSHANCTKKTVTNALENIRLEEQIRKAEADKRKKAAGVVEK